MLADILGVVVMVLLVSLSQLRESIPSLVEAEIAARAVAGVSLPDDADPVALFVDREGIRAISGSLLENLDLDLIIQEIASQDRRVELCIRPDINWSETAPLLGERLGPRLAGRAYFNTDTACWPF
jgi:hypothetical protein